MVEEEEAVTGILLVLAAFLEVEVWLFAVVVFVPVLAVSVVVSDEVPEIV